MIIIKTISTLVFEIMERNKKRFKFHTFLLLLGHFVPIRDFFLNAWSMGKIKERFLLFENSEVQGGIRSILFILLSCDSCAKYSIWNINFSRSRGTAKRKRVFHSIIWLCLFLISLFISTDSIWPKCLISMTWFASMYYITLI